MDFPFFEALTSDEAADYLDRFLSLGNEQLAGFVAAAERDGVVADLSVSSIEQVVGWVARSARTIPLDPGPVAFYMGESFIRAFPGLSWGVGRPDTAPQGQPVVTGFRRAVEMPVLLVAENLVARAVSGVTTPEGDVPRAVAAWQAVVAA